MIESLGIKPSQIQQLSTCSATRQQAKPVCAMLSIRLCTLYGWPASATNQPGALSMHAEYSIQWIVIMKPLGCLHRQMHAHVLSAQCSLPCLGTSVQQRLLAGGDGVLLLVSGEETLPILLRITNSTGWLVRLESHRRMFHDNMDEDGWPGMQDRRWQLLACMPAVGNRSEHYGRRAP